MKKESKLTESFLAPNVPTPPFWGARIIENIQIDNLFNLINIPALYRISWGLKNASGEKWEKYQRIFGEKLETFRNALKRNNWLSAAAVYGYFHSSVDGDDLIINRRSDPVSGSIRFHFPRQKSGDCLSIVDFFHTPGEKVQDLCIFQIVTMGNSAAEHIQSMQKHEGISEAYYAHGLAVALTEAAARWLHGKIRRELGIHEKQGKRYSWGYPQLPDLSEHKKLFELLPADQIGVSLTSAYQMIPEYSTAALILHHKNASYFRMNPQESRHL